MIHPHSASLRPAIKSISLFIIPISFVAMMLLFSPFDTAFELDKDEGVNLMKALLLCEDHSLYSEIWSDQPPLLTYALAGAFRLFGADVEVGRLVVLAYSALLLWCAGYVVAAVSGIIAAVAVGVLIVLLPYYAQLSISVMVGLPALALAVMSLAMLIAWHRRRQTRWLVLSAVVLALSVMTKALTLLLVPIIVAGLLVTAHAEHRAALSWRVLKQAILWLAVFGLVAGAIILFMVGPDNVSQLVETHLAARRVPEYQQLSISTVRSNAGGMLLLACVGGLVALLRRRWLALYPLAWAVVAYAVLLWHAPVWYHQQLTVTVPAAMLGAVAVGEALNWLRSAGRRSGLVAAGALTLIVCAGVGYIVIDQVPSVVSFLGNSEISEAEHMDADEKAEIVGQIAAHADETTWMLTDRPMYAFRANVCVPPNLAVITRKRLATGALTEPQVLESVTDLKPEQVLLTRFRWPTITGYLDAHYGKAYADEGRTLYLRDDLLDSGGK